VAQRNRLARRKSDRTAPPPWFATAAWISGLIVAATIVWLWIEHSGDMTFVAHR